MDVKQLQLNKSSLATSRRNGAGLLIFIPIQHFFKMTNEQFFEQIQPTLDQSKKSGDPFLVCHFSREQDRFKGVNWDMDAADAMIIVSHLIAEFGLDSKAIAGMKHVSRKTD